MIQYAPENGQKKRTRSLAFVALSTTHALPRTLRTLPSSVSCRQVLTTAMSPSARSEYSAVTPTHPRWKRWGIVAISYQVPR